MVATPTAVFDLYYVMVEVLFGSVLVSGLAMCALIIIICLLGRMSLFTSIIWTLFFIITFSVFYLGALALVLSAVIGFVYLAIAIVRYFFPDV